MNDEAYAVVSIDTSTGATAVRAIITRSHNGLSAHKRARDLVERLMLDPGRPASTEYLVQGAPLDPDNETMNVIGTLDEVDSASIVVAALIELRMEGEVLLPGWVHTGWLVKQLVSYDIVAVPEGQKLKLHKVGSPFPHQRFANDAGFQENEDFD